MLSIELRARQTTAKVIWVNLISVIINIILAISAFYFAFINDSSATGAFAADCVLDFVSSAIVLWRYFGDLTSEYAHIREQIACLYLGALFELSALAIIIKAIKDITGGDPVDHTPEMGYFQQPSDGVSVARIKDTTPSLPNNTSINLKSLTNAETKSTELVFLASAATLACLILTLFKCNLYRELKDNSILLDVINTLISSVFAISIVMSQVLISLDSSFWYLDPVLSIVLALFMMAFGIKVLHQNIGLLKRHQHYEQTHLFDGQDDMGAGGVINEDQENGHHYVRSARRSSHQQSQNRHYRDANLTASYDDHLHLLSSEKRSKRHKNQLDQNNNQGDNNDHNNHQQNTHNSISGGFKRSNYGTNLSLSMDCGQLPAQTIASNSHSNRSPSTLRAILTCSNSNNNLEVDLTSSSYHRQIFHDHDHHTNRTTSQQANNQETQTTSGNWTKAHYPNILIR